MRLPTASHFYSASPLYSTEAEQPKNSSSPLSDTALYLWSITWSGNGAVNLNILGNFCIQQSICPRCEEEDETVRHWLGCPASMRIREEIFGKANLRLDVLSQQPRETLAYAEKTLMKTLWRSAHNNNNNNNSNNRGLFYLVRSKMCCQQDWSNSTVLWSGSTFYWWATSVINDRVFFFIWSSG